MKKSDFQKQKRWLLLNEFAEQTIINEMEQNHERNGEKLIPLEATLSRL